MSTGIVVIHSNIDGMIYWEKRRRPPLRDYSIVVDPYTVANTFGLTEDEHELARGNIIKPWVKNAAAGDAAYTKANEEELDPVSQIHMRQEGLLIASSMSLGYFLSCFENEETGIIGYPFMLSEKKLGHLERANLRHDIIPLD